MNSNMNFNYDIDYSKDKSIDKRILEVCAIAEANFLRDLKKSNIKNIPDTKDLIINNNSNDNFINRLPNNDSKKALEANRSNNPYPDQKDCNDCAKKLFYAATQKKELLNDTFLYIFTQKSREELALIAQIYFEWYTKTLFELVKSSFSGDAKRILKAIVYALLSPSEYFAYRVNKAVKGLGTKDTMLIRIVVSRDEIDMERIKRYYKQMYNKEMYDDVKSDVSGDYKTILLALIGR